jgi:hypothetical protein
LCETCHCALIFSLDIQRSREFFWNNAGLYEMLIEKGRAGFDPCGPYPSARPPELKNPSRNIPENRFARAELSGRVNHQGYAENFIYEPRRQLRQEVFRNPGRGIPTYKVKLPRVAAGDIRDCIKRNRPDFFKAATSFRIVAAMPRMDLVLLSL